LGDVVKHERACDGTPGTASALSPVMSCPVCDNTGWVCENHPDRPFKMFSKRFDACNCGAGAPCDLCNPSDADDPPDMWTCRELA
jgi:hypothetical protein